MAMQIIGLQIGRYEYLQQSGVVLTILDQGFYIMWDKFGHLSVFLCGQWPRYWVVKLYERYPWRIR